MCMRLCVSLNKIVNCETQIFVNCFPNIKHYVSVDVYIARLTSGFKA